MAESSEQVAKLQVPPRLRTPLNARLERFALEYGATARELYLGEDGQPVHRGEYGGHRERLVRQLLREFLPAAYGVSEGFIISPDGDISTQCDIVVYWANSPVLTLSEDQRFFPVESVVAVGEVKSKLESGELSDALPKLVRVKEMRATLSPTIYTSDRGRFARDPRLEQFDPRDQPWDQVVTFVVCHEIGIADRATLESHVFRSTSGRSPILRLNLLAGVCGYQNQHGYVMHYAPELVEKGSRAWPFDRYLYPVPAPFGAGQESQGRPLGYTMARHDDPFLHLRAFLRYLVLLVDAATVLQPDLGSYLDVPEPVGTPGETET